MMITVGKVWNSKYWNIVRVVALVVLLAAIWGPWLYTFDGVPPPEWCRPPNILFENGRCAALVSGTTALTFMVWLIPSLIAQLVTGALVLPERARELIGVLIIIVSVGLLIFPFLSTLFVIPRGNSQRGQIFQVIVWGLAVIASFLPILFDVTLRSTLFWGIWLYIGLAVSMFVWETLALVTDAQHVSKP